MGNIGDTISDSAPAVSTSGPGYASTINALLTEFKTRLSARIPLSSLLTNSNLDLNGQALLNAAYLTLANESESPVASPVNRVAAYGGNLWWVSPSGAVQLTSGASLNAAGVGGITGDYSGAGPMEFRYDTGNTRYDAFANQSTNTWAYVRARGFDIAGSATSAFRARLLFGGTANVSYTLPTAAPGSTAVMQMSAAGQITASNTMPGTLTGTEFNHTQARFKPFMGSSGAPAAGTTVSIDGPDATFTSSGGTLYYMPEMDNGDIVDQVLLRLNKTSGGDITVTLFTYNQITDSSSIYDGPYTYSTAGEGTLTCVVNTPSVIVSGSTLLIEVIAPAVADQVFSGYVVYRRA